MTNNDMKDFSNSLYLEIVGKIYIKSSGQDTRTKVYEGKHYLVKCVESVLSIDEIEKFERVVPEIGKL